MPIWATPSRRGPVPSRVCIAVRFYGAFFLSHVPEELIESLLDKLTTGRVEIDVLDLSGSSFAMSRIRSWR